MSIGIVLPSVLHKIGIKIGADLKQIDNFHISTNYKSAKSMIDYFKQFKICQKGTSC